MRDALDEQIEAYQAMLPDLKRRYGAVWVLIARKKFVDTFQEFASAARFSAENFASEQVLIRHTGEAAEVAPFVHIET